MTGIAGCCARAASGHAAALPSIVMSSRRFIAAIIRSPRRRGRAASAELPSFHSVTSSAVASSVAGTARPNILEASDRIERAAETLLVFLDGLD